ncbi:hypothetical protein LSTR_LSTR012642 [Laodelphax striatellus]|uniref:ZAD domain-containing protein n=1 Tax=Laodelphax striatellus TaxID=195883 RepID=A0A482XI77_LAOST|nr:hypothetical protein LSTR_LSTR012642 [Laodelphax striatellus]
MDGKKEQMVVVLMNDEDAKEYSRNHGEELENTYVVVNDPVCAPEDDNVSLYQNRTGVVQKQEEVIITSEDIPVHRTMATERKLVKINSNKISRLNPAERQILSSPKRKPVEMKTPSSNENPPKRKFPATDARKSKPKLDICRLCLSKNCELLPLFWTKLRFSALKLSHVIETCIGIRVDKEDVTDRVCQACLINLESVWAFREKCQQSNETITKMNLNINNVKPISGSEIPIPDKRRPTEDNVYDATFSSLVSCSLGGQKVQKSRKNRESKKRHTTIEDETVEIEIDQGTASDEWTAEEAVAMADDPEVTHSDQEIADADQDSEMQVEPETPSERVPGLREGTWLYTDGKGYYYTADQVRNSKRYLTCTESVICAARGIMRTEENAPIHISRNTEHSHPPNFQFAEERRFMYQMRKRAVEDTHLTIPEIIKEVEAGITPGIDVKILKRQMLRSRQTALKQRPMGHMIEN